MSFTSMEFWIFFLVFSFYYYFYPPLWKMAALLLASLFFYGYLNPVFLIPLGLSILVDFFLVPYVSPERNHPHRKLIAGINIGFNFGLLFFYKFFNPWPQTLSFPIGISFYTFKSVSYVLDVYRGRMAAERSFLKLAVYVAYFPQLLAGPIERAHRLLPQINRNLRWGGLNWEPAVQLILWGLYKKVCIGDKLTFPIMQVFAHPDPEGGPWSVLAASLIVTFKVYCDFSGYTDIARGISLLLGIDLNVNFRRFYYSGSPVEFWQRWHMSMAQWIKDYLFSALKPRRYNFFLFNGALFITFLLMGFWHGLKLNWILFGAFHGIVMMIYWSGRKWEKGRRFLVKTRLNFFLMFLFYGVCGLLHQAGTSNDLLILVESLFRHPEKFSLARSLVLYSLILLLPLFLYEGVAEKKSHDAPILLAPFPFRLVFYIFLFEMVILMRGELEPFVYYQF